MERKKGMKKVLIRVFDWFVNCRWKKIRNYRWWRHTRTPEGRREMRKWMMYRTKKDDMRPFVFEGIYYFLIRYPHSSLDYALGYWKREKIKKVRLLAWMSIIISFILYIFQSFMSYIFPSLVASFVDIFQNWYFVVLVVIVMGYVLYRVCFFVNYLGADWEDVKKYLEKISITRWRNRQNESILFYDPAYHRISKEEGITLREIAGDAGIDLRFVEFPERGFEDNIGGIISLCRIYRKKNASFSHPRTEQIAEKASKY